MNPAPRVSLLILYINIQPGAPPPPLLRPYIGHQVNQDPKPFGDKTPDCSEDPTAVQTLLERFSDLSWNIDGLPDDCLDPKDSQVPITSFVHEVLPQVTKVCCCTVLGCHESGLRLAFSMTFACRYKPCHKASKIEVEISRAWRGVRVPSTAPSAFDVSSGPSLHRENKYKFPLSQVEKVFAVDSVEEAIDNLRGRREPWAHMALQNIGEPCVEVVRIVWWARSFLRAGTQSMLTTAVSSLCSVQRRPTSLNRASDTLGLPLRAHTTFLCVRFACQHVAERSSPLSLKVVFEQVKRGGGMSLQESLDDEFSVNTHLFGMPDFEMAMQARETGVRLTTEVAPQTGTLHFTSNHFVRRPIPARYEQTALILNLVFAAIVREGHQLGKAAVWRTFLEIKSLRSSRKYPVPSRAQVVLAGLLHFPVPNTCQPGEKVVADFLNGGVGWA